MDTGRGGTAAPPPDRGGRRGGSKRPPAPGPSPGAPPAKRARARDLPFHPPSSPVLRALSAPDVHHRPSGLEEEDPVVGLLYRCHLDAAVLAAARLRTAGGGEVRRAEVEDWVRRTFMAEFEMRRLTGGGNKVVVLLGQIAKGGEKAVMLRLVEALATGGGSKEDRMQALRAPEVRAAVGRHISACLKQLRGSKGKKPLKMFLDWLVEANWECGPQFLTDLSTSAEESVALMKQVFDLSADKGAVQDAARELHAVLLRRHRDLHHVSPGSLFAVTRAASGSKTRAVSPPTAVAVAVAPFSNAVNQPARRHAAVAGSSSAYAVAAARMKATRTKLAVPAAKAVRAKSSTATTQAPVPPPAAGGRDEQAKRSGAPKKVIGGVPKIVPTRSARRQAANDPSASAPKMRAPPPRPSLDITTAFQPANNDNGSNPSRTANTGLRSAPQSAPTASARKRNPPSVSNPRTEKSTLPAVASSSPADVPAASKDAPAKRGQGLVDVPTPVTAPAKPLTASRLPSVSRFDGYTAQQNRLPPPPVSRASLPAASLPSATPQARMPVSSSGGPVARLAVPPTGTTRPSHPTSGSGRTRETPTRPVPDSRRLSVPLAHPLRTIPPTTVAVLVRAPPATDPRAPPAPDPRAPPATDPRAPPATDPRAPSSSYGRASLATDSRVANASDPRSGPRHPPIPGPRTDPGINARTDASTRAMTTPNSNPRIDPRNGPWADSGINGKTDPSTRAMTAPDRNPRIDPRTDPRDSEVGPAKQGLRGASVPIASSALDLTLPIGSALAAAHVPRPTPEPTPLREASKTATFEEEIKRMRRSPPLHIIMAVYTQMREELEQRMARARGVERSLPRTGLIAYPRVQGPG